MHLVWHIFGVIGLTVTLLLLGAGTWVWCVVVRNILVSVRASAALANPHGAYVTLPSAFGHATAQPIYPVNNEVN